MPVWVPPSPPHDDNDVYIDRHLSLSYEAEPMGEDRLPPVWVNKRELKKLKLDGTAATAAGTAPPVAGVKTEGTGGIAEVGAVFWNGSRLRKDCPCCQRPGQILK